MHHRLCWAARVWAGLSVIVASMLLLAAAQDAHCDNLGHHGARLNACGFCVGGTTGLDRQHGRDCAGKCNGRAVVDCNGVCGGSAYVDPCSKECIYGKFSKVYAKRNITADRDCRGACLVPGVKPTYGLDQCGVCAKTPAKEPSPYKDCLGVCHLPAHRAKMAETHCGSCVGGNSPTPKADVVDGCGNCVSSKAHCECDGKGAPDPCGVCGGHGDSCFTVTGIRPLAAPSGADVKVTIYGAFGGEMRDVLCLFRRSDDNEGTTITASGKGTGTSFTCQAKRFLEGTYLVSARLSRLGKEAKNGNISFTVFDRNVSYDKMEPTNAPYRPEENKADAVKVIFSGGNVPRFPLSCILVAADKTPKKILVPARDDGWNECDLPLPPSSVEYAVYPSLDGQNPAGNGFHFTFYATRPQIETSFITEDGSSVVVLFDRPLNSRVLKTCEDILAPDTLSLVGEGATCKWATKYQLVVTPTNFIPGDKVKIALRPDNVTEDKQKITVDEGPDLKTDAKRVAVTGTLSVNITGPTVVPLCGEFDLIAHYSWPLGPVETFAWSAVRNDSMPLMDPLKSHLKTATRQYLRLNAEDLDFGVEYTFTVKVSADSKNMAEDSHSVLRAELNAPIVTVYSSTLLSSQQLQSHHEVTLYTETVIPYCNDTILDLEYAWSVDDPRVRFDFDAQNSPVYKIPPHTLPYDSGVTFTVKVGSFDRLNGYGEASVTLDVAPVTLSAVVKGGPRRMVGCESQNDVVLDASPSSGSPVPLVFQWSCVDEDMQPCYDYGPGATEALLINPVETNREKLVIMAERLQPNKTLNFTVEVFRSDNDSSTRSASASTTVLTSDQKIPLVVLEGVYVNNVPTYTFDAEEAMVQVPAGPPVVVHASFVAHSRSVSIQWKVNSFSFPYSTTGIKRGLEGDTYLTIPEDSIVPHGIYKSDVQICEKGLCGNSSLTLYGKPGPSSCRLQVLVEDTIQALNATEAVVTGCAIPPDSHPMTYQLFLDQDSDLIPLSVVQFSPVVKFVVPLNNFTNLCAQVCDREHQCHYYCNYSLPTSAPSYLNDSVDFLAALAIRQYREGKKLDSVATLLVALQGSEVPDTPAMHDQLLASVFQSTSNKNLQPGDIYLLYRAMILLMDGGNVDLTSGALEATSVISEVALKKEIPVDLNVVKMAYLQTQVVQKAHPGNDQVRRNVENAQKRLEQVIASRLPKGQLVRIVSDQVTHIHHRFLNREQIFIPSPDHVGVTDVVLAFNKNLWERYHKWRCGDRICQGIVVVVTVYQTNPFVESDIGTRMTPVVSVTFRTPDTGKEVKVRDLKDALSLKLRQTGNGSRVPGMVQRCFRWQERDEEWTLDRMTLLGVHRKMVACLASDTGVFTVYEITDGLGIAAIAGIVVSCLMSVFILAAFVMFAMHKKQTTASAKVADQAVR